MRFKTSLLGILAVTAFMTLAACAGVKARDEVLTPVAASAWNTQGIQADVLYGIADALQAGTITPQEADDIGTRLAMVGTALDEGDRAFATEILQANWTEFRAYAVAGAVARVEDGDFSPNDYNNNGTPDAVDSIVERLNQFEHAAAVLGERLDD